MPRIPELDALRGLAALAILHYHFLLFERFGHDASEGCWAAVELFFVLSGYLITSIIIANIRKPNFFLNFYARRTLRIWPLYYLALGAVIGMNVISRYPNPMDGLPWHLVFLQNIQRYWGATPPPFDWHFTHSWTLAVEEQFYIVWPVLLTLFGIGRLRLLCGLAVAISAIALFRGFHPWLLISRCGGFAMGGWIAAILHSHSPGPEGRTTSSRLAWLAAILLPFAYLSWGRVARGADFLGERPSIILAFSTMFAGLVGLTIIHSGRPALGLLRLRALRYLGKISFGIYIWHQVLFSVFKAALLKVGVANPYLRYGCYYVAAISVAAASWHFFESPILRLKDLFSYRQSDPGQSPS